MAEVDQLQLMSNNNDSSLGERPVNIKVFMHDLLSVVQNIIAGAVSITSVDNENAWKIEGEINNPVVMLYYNSNTEICHYDSPHSSDQNEPSFHIKKEVQDTCELADGEMGRDADLNVTCVQSMDSTMAKPAVSQYDPNRPLPNEYESPRCDFTGSQQLLDSISCTTHDANINVDGCVENKSSHNSPAIEHKPAKDGPENSHSATMHQSSDIVIELSNDTDDFVSVHPIKQNTHSVQQNHLQNPSISIQQPLPITVVDSTNELNDIKRYISETGINKIPMHTNAYNPPKTFDYTSGLSIAKDALPINVQSESSDHHQAMNAGNVQSNLKPGGVKDSLPNFFYSSKKVFYEYDWKYKRMLRGEKFSCRYCSKTFAQKGGLKAHERMHTGYDTYTCSYCSKTFSYKCWLISHERTHTGERPFACAYCPKKFSQISNLKTHEHRHTDLHTHVQKCAEQIFQNFHE